MQSLFQKSILLVKSRHNQSRQIRDQQLLLGLEFLRCLFDLLKNEFLLKKRIIGLTSYFPDIEELLPRFNKDVNFYIINLDMSDFQLKIYEKARNNERKIEAQKSLKKALNEEE